jgi:hypothetical protein
VHPAGADTVTLLDPPSAEYVAVAGAMPNEHTGEGSIGESWLPQLPLTVTDAARTIKSARDLPSISHLLTCPRQVASRRLVLESPRGSARLPQFEPRRRQDEDYRF